MIRAHQHLATATATIAVYLNNIPRRIEEVGTHLGLENFPFPAPRDSTTPVPQNQQSCNPHQTACLCLLGQPSALGEGQASASGSGWSRALTRGNASAEDLGPLGKGVISLSIVGIHRISSHARAAVEWTVEELARRTGLTAKTIHRYEHGENATIETLERIKAAFEAEGVTMDPGKWRPRHGLSAAPQTPGPRSVTLV